MKKRVPLLLIFLFFTKIAFAQVPVLEIKELDKGKMHSFIPFLSVWVDTSATQTISNVTAPQIQQKFVPLNIKHFDHQAKSYWLRCNLNNLNNDSVKLGLQIGIFERVDIFLQDSNHLSTQNSRLILTRLYKKATDYEYISLPAGTSTLYFHITRAHDISIVMSSYVLSGMAFFSKDFSNFWIEDRHTIQTIYILYAGGLSLLLFYNLLLFFTLRDKAYFFYIISLCAILVGNIDFYAYIVAPSPPKYQIFLMWGRVALWAVSHFLFILSFLKLNEWLYWASRATKVMIGIGVLLFVCLFVAVLYPYIVTLYALYFAASCLFLMVIALVAFMKRRGDVRFYFLGNIAFLVGAVITLLEFLRIVPASIYTHNALFFGSLIEMTLFSLALADKISAAKKELVEQKLLQSVEREQLAKEQNEELEQKVKERTQEIQVRNEELEQKVKERTQEIQLKNEELNKKNREIEIQSIELQKLNSNKDKLFSIIAHDLRSPIAALGSAINILDPHILNSTELELIKTKLYKQFKNTDETLQNLLLWAKDQMQGEMSNPTLIDLNKLINEKIDFLNDIAANKNITLKNQTNVDSQVFADENYLRIILRNLISNALKFSYENSEITIFNYTKNDIMETIAVKDTGKGMDEAQKAMLFTEKGITTKGTAGEIGTGLGLSLVKNIVEKSGGKIWVESEVGEGSTFYFTLPKA